MSYDRAAGVMTLDCVGGLTVKCSRNITLEAGQPLVVKAPSATLEISQVAPKDNLQVEGNISETGTIMDAGGNRNHHTH